MPPEPMPPEPVSPSSMPAEPMPPELPGPAPLCTGIGDEAALGIDGQIEAVTALGWHTAARSWAPGWCG